MTEGERQTEGRDKERERESGRDRDGETDSGREKHRKGERERGQK